MNCEYIYGYPFYTFEIPDSIIDTVYTEIQNVVYEEVFYANDREMPSYSGHTVKDGMKSCYYNKELYDILDRYLNQIYKKHFKFAIEQQIVNLWPTKTVFGRHAWYHSHAHSIFSGLVYLHDSKTSTLFKFEDQIEKIWKHFVYVNSCNSELVYESKAVKGKVIIWPSVIDHKIDIHREKTPRFTVAFNSFWNGRLNSSTTGFLDINTTPAKDMKVV